MPGRLIMPDGIGSQAPEGVVLAQRGPGVFLAEESLAPQDWQHVFDERLPVRTAAPRP